MKHWQPYFAGCLAHWLGVFREEGLREPRSVTRHTDKYRKDNNPHQYFFTNELCMSINYKCSQTKLNCHWQNWCKERNIQGEKSLGMWLEKHHNVKSKAGIKPDNDIQPNTTCRIGVKFANECYNDPSNRIEKI